MRCLALAHRLRDVFDVEFVCRDLPGALIAWLGEQGYRVHPLASPRALSPGWLGVATDEEIREFQTLARARGEHVRALVVDHYGLDARWESAAVEAFSRRPAILAIDDLHDRPHTAPLVLNQNYHHDWTAFDFLPPPTARWLKGPQYALLRPEFVALRAPALERSPGRRGLVFFGGVDAPGATNRVVEVLRAQQGLGWNWEIVVGRSNPHRAVLERSVEGCAYLRLEISPADFSTRLSRTDLFVGAGGSTSWERCCLAVPSVVIAIAENQVRMSADLASDGFQQYLGSWEELAADTLAGALAQATRNPESLRQMARRSAALVDGQGASRIAEILAEAARV